MHIRSSVFSLCMCHPATPTTASPASTFSSSHTERSGLITMSDGVYSFLFSETSFSPTRLSEWVNIMRALVKNQCPFYHEDKEPLPMRCSFTYYLKICPHMWIDTDFFIAHLVALESDLLPGEEKKACDEILLIPSCYLPSELSLSCSAAYYVIAYGNLIMLSVQIGLPDAVQQEKKSLRERTRNRWQLTSPLYRIYFKCLHPQHKEVTLFFFLSSLSGFPHSILHPQQNISLWTLLLE